MKTKILILLFLTACSTNTNSPVEAVDDTQVLTDLASDTVTQINRDEAGSIQVGVARVLLPAPVGIGTAGYGPEAGPDVSKSRYAENFPATQGVYTHPSLHAVAVEGMHQKVVFLRTDTVGVSVEIRQAIVAEVLDRGGPDLADGLLLAATHTHSGPGRLVKHQLFEAGFDVFFPAFYERLISAAADAVMGALADLEPAQFGFVIAKTDELHNDRRCENPDFLDGSLPILRFDRMDGTPKALVMSYSAHGTIIDMDKRLLSRDFHGGIELKIEEHFAHPVTALFFNSWSGDTSPKTGHVDDAGGLSDDFNGIESAGNTAAKIVLEAMDGMSMSSTVPLWARTTYFEFNREDMGYKDGVWPYPYGAIYCGITIQEEVCWGEGEPPEPEMLSSGCIPFSEEFPAPWVTAIAGLRIGDLYLVTLPGEPGSRLSVDMMDAIKTESGIQNLGLIGYANDYIGYSLEESDWYRGGYEASGAIWGPKQGDYLVKHAREYMLHLIRGTPLSWEPRQPRPAYVLEATHFSAEKSLSAPIVMVQPVVVAAPGDLIVASILGGDPWFLPPRIEVQRLNAEGAFEPLRRKNGSILSSDGYEFETQLATTPSYEEHRDPTDRDFEWSFIFSTRRPAPTTTQDLAGGSYRFRITGKIQLDGATIDAYELYTDPFSVTR